MSRQNSGKQGMHSSVQKEDSVRDSMAEEHARGNPVSGSFSSHNRHADSSLRNITNAANGGDPGIVESIEPDGKLKGTHAKYEEGE